MALPSSQAVEMQQLHDLVEELADQLCPAVDGEFDFLVKVSAHNETIDKLQMLVNLVLDAARRSVRVLSQRNASLKAAHDEIRESLAELEAFNNAAIDRELRMVEMKEEVNALAAELGQGTRYDVSFDDSEAVTRESVVDATLESASVTENS